MLRRTFILCLPAMAGCRSQSHTTGDFALFFVSEMRARGGRMLPLDPLPVIKGRWRVERDDHGFQIQLVGVAFDQVDSFLRHVLGKPAITVEQNLHGYPQRMYESTISGMHIQLVGEKDAICIVAFGPQKHKE